MMRPWSKEPQYMTLSERKTGGPHGQPPRFRELHFPSAVVHLRRALGSRGGDAEDLAGQRIQNPLFGHVVLPRQNTHEPVGVGLIDLPRRDEADAWNADALGVADTGDIALANGGAADDLIGRIDGAGGTNRDVLILDDTAAKDGPDLGLLELVLAPLLSLQGDVLEGCVGPQ